MIKAERGYIIPAIDSEGTQYHDCAVRLANSIRSWHPDANVFIMTKDDLPFPSQSGYRNDWQVFWASPYRQTIKLEADMLATSPIDHWWTFFEHQDVVISQGIRNFQDQPSDCRRYRKLFDDNSLPDVYNAITYWRLSATAKEFFVLVRGIFENWDLWRQLLKFPEEEPSTDVVYAMAAQIMGPERVTMPVGTGPTMVHMKQHVIGTETDDWTKELIWERDGPELSIQTIKQWGFFHYHIKHWT